MNRPQMKIEISVEPITELAEYAIIPIAFEVRRVFDITVPLDGASDLMLTERGIENPYIKNYDAIENPLDWPRRFDMANWVMITARIDGYRVGGAIVAFNTAGLDML